MVVLIHSVNFFYKGLDGILEVGNLKNRFYDFFGEGGGSNGCGKIRKIGLWQIGCSKMVEIGLWQFGT